MQRKLRDSICDSLGKLLIRAVFIAGSSIAASGANPSLSMDAVPPGLFQGEHHDSRVVASGAVISDADRPVAELKCSRRNCEGDMIRPPHIPWPIPPK